MKTQARTSMKRMLTLTLLALSISSTFGFIGATEKQCRKKYSGKVSAAVKPLADKTLIWKDNNNEVLICFIDGLAHCVIHLKAGGAKFEDSDVKQIMKDNGDGLEWVEVHGTSSWIRADHKILLTKDSKMNGYILATSKWMDLRKKKGTYEHDDDSATFRKTEQTVRQLPGTDTGSQTRHWHCAELQVVLCAKACQCKPAIAWKFIPYRRSLGFVT